MSDRVEQSISVMVADDELSIRETIAHQLTKLGYTVHTFPSGADCMDAFRKNPADVLITDLRMPGMDGIQLLRQVKDVSPSAEVIIITAHADKSTAIEALKLGAFDFFEKPISLAELGETIRRTVRYQTALRDRDRLEQQVSALSSREAARWGVKAMIGHSRAVKTILNSIQLLQKAEHTSVLITGESGTGKELVARAIHSGSNRANGPFIAVNCSAMPAELAESELFGHVKGAFTGATSNRKGCFELAHQGTLFLDEIGDMPTPLQAKLLRVLEDGIITPVGGNRGTHVNVRVIAATNSRVEKKIAEGQFRQDLYFRLARYSIVVPPLRERKGDIPLLAQHFVITLSAEMGMSAPPIAPEALSLLEAYTYPGNVREFKNIMERALIESGGHDIRREHIHFSNVAHDFTEAASDTRLTPPAPSDTNRSADSAGGDLPTNLQDAETVLIRRAMTLADGNVSAAARLLGINRTKLHRKLHRL